MSAPWLFITVSDESTASRAHLRALLASLQRQDAAADLVLVMRGCDEQRASEADCGCVRVHPLFSPLRAVGGVVLTARRRLTATACLRMLADAIALGTGRA